MSQTLPDLFAAARSSPTAPVLRVPGGAEMSYFALDQEVERWASGLARAGVQTGDRVVYQVAKSPTTIVLHLALLRCGAIQVPLNPAYSDAEVTELLVDAEPSLFIRDPSRSELSGPWQKLTLDAGGDGTARELSVGDTSEMPTLVPSAGAALLYTSGTTGRPKGALLTHENLSNNASTLVEAWGFTGHDVLLHILPLFHTHGLFVATHCVLASGASMVLLPSFDVTTALGAMTECTVVMGVPTHYSRLLAEERFDADLVRGVRLFVSGSAPMSAPLHGAFAARTGKSVLERYGMTETSMLTSNPLDGLRKPGFVGPPLPGVDVRVADDEDVETDVDAVGHVQVKGANVFGGYWRRPELTADTFTVDGWFRTGDLGRFDDDGYLELVGRSKDLVITGGLNVYPRDVEDVLDAIAGVHESAVVGIPDADLGERVVAIVVVETGATLDGDDIRAAVRQSLAGYKVPKQVLFVDDLPRNAMGKVEKSLLRAMAQGLEQ